MDQQKIWDYFQNEGMDTFSLSRGRLEFISRQLFPRTRVLNIGVGNGALEALACAKNVDIWSLDPSERAIDRLRQTLSVGQKAQVGFSQKMPFPDSHFDAVVMSEVLEHLDDVAFEATLTEVRRVLRPNGRFIGTVPARERLADQHVVCPRCEYHFHRWGHQRAFDIDGLTRALNTQFIVNVATETFFIDWESVNIWYKLKGLVKKLLSWRGIGTYGVCRNIFFVAKIPEYPSIKR